MRSIVLVMAMFTLAGCSGVQQDVTHLQQEQDAISAAAKRIKVVAGTNVNGHPQYTKLGRAEGYCMNRPNTTGGQLVHGDSLKTSAYRKYGDQVDAIVNTTVWFIADDNSGGFEPYAEEGYFECAGTAVHFTGESAPVASSQPPPS